MAQQNTMSYWVKNHYISKVTGKDAIDYIDFWRHPQKTYKPILKMHIEYVAKNVNNYIVQDELTQAKWLEIWRDDGVHDENKELLYKCTIRELLDMAQDYALSKGWDGYDKYFDEARGKLKESRKGVNRMNKRFTEKTEDYEDLLEQYGMEYLMESNPDDVPYDMDEMDEYLSGMEPSEAIRKAFFGSRWNFKNDGFNPNDEYFAFDGYANLVSIAKYDLVDYLSSSIDEPYFMEWLADNGYIDEE